MVNVNKKYVKIVVGGLAVSALAMGISVGLTTKKKNNSNVSPSNAVKKYFDFDENAMEKRLTEQAVGSAANVGKSGGTTRMLIVPETEEYAAHVTSGMGRQLCNDLTRREFLSFAIIFIVVVVTYLGVVSYLFFFFTIYNILV